MISTVFKTDRQKMSTTSTSGVSKLVTSFSRCPLPTVGCPLPSVGCPLPSVGCPLSGDTEGHVGTRLCVETHQPLQGGRVDHIKACLASERAGLPVLWWADRISQKAFQGEGCPHFHHALSKYGPRPGPFQQQARVELQGVNVAIKILQFLGYLFLTCRQIMILERGLYHRKTGNMPMKITQGVLEKKKCI